MKFQPSLPQFSNSFVPKMVYLRHTKDQMELEECSICIVRPFQNFAAEFLTRVFARLSRWWFFSLSTSTSLGSMWWKWTKMGQRTPANQDVSRLSPSQRRNSSPSQPIRTPTYGDFLFGLGGYSTHVHITHVHSHFHNRPLQFYLKCPVLFPRSWEMCNLKAKTINWHFLGQYFT